MDGQKEYLKKRQYGGTIRLGAWPCLLTKDTLLWRLYQEYGKAKDAPWNMPNGVTASQPKDIIYERHRHRYEFNNKYKTKFEDAGMVISGTSPDSKLVESVELRDHPFFLGTQFHPEYISRPLSPHPVFLGFIRAALG
jgi:CTP synthase